MLVKALYQWQLAGHAVAEIEGQFEAMADFQKCDREYFAELLRTVVDDSVALDAEIARRAVRSIEQLDAVGHAILLLGLAELKFRPDVPAKVVINEAVELAKRYGASDSHRFVNAVLDKTARELKRVPVPGEEK
jgi:N utilization substance protein B